MFPLIYRMVDKYQFQDRELVAKLILSNYHTKENCGGGNFAQLIFRSDQMVMTKVL